MTAALRPLPRSCILMTEIPEFVQANTLMHGALKNLYPSLSTPCRWGWLQLALEFVAIATMCGIMLAGLLAQVRRWKTCNSVLRTPANFSPHSHTFLVALTHQLME